MNLNELRDEIHANAIEKGFWTSPLSDSHCLMLVITELSEAVEADRKGKLFDKEKYEYNEMTECQGWLTSEEKFINVFNRCIKDTVEDELADAVIRLLDLAGLRDVSLELATVDIDTCIDDMAESCKDETFTESIYAISTLPVRYDGLYDFTTTINDMLMSIFGLAKYLNIDLLWHIEQKMKYNQLREKMHGKKY